MNDWHVDLQRAVAEMLALPTVRIDAADARAGGMSHLNLVTLAPGGAKYVVRVAPPRGPLEPYDLMHEITQVLLAERAGVPVAHPLGIGHTRSPGQVPFALYDHVSGEVLVPGSEYALAHADQVAEELIRTLVAIHGTDMDGALGDVPLAPETLLSRWSATLAEVTRTDTPVLPSYVRGWLGRHVPEPTDRVLVHGDYRLGNMIWDGTRIAAVLDWEYADAGDPLFDLAWLLMGTSGDDDLVMGLAPRSTVVARYRELSGRRFSAAQLAWWEVMVAWMRVVIEIKAIRLNQDSDVPDLRALLWEFGHGSSYGQILSAIDRADRLARSEVGA